MVCDRGSDTHRGAMVLIGMVLFWVSRVLLDVLRITTGDGPISGNQLISVSLVAVAIALLLGGAIDRWTPEVVRTPRRWSGAR